MAPPGSRISYSFGIALALIAICSIYLPHWKHYVQGVHITGAMPPYLTPWTVVFVALLSLALALLSAPLTRPSPSVVVISKVLCALVICSGVVFLLEYATGIRFPDLDTFFLLDATGRQISPYAARPTPNSAVTSLFFSSALLFYRSDSVWRKRLYQMLVAAAFVLPAIAAVRYLGSLFVARHAMESPRAGLWPPAIALYFLLGSGILGLSFRTRFQKVLETDLRGSPAQPI